MTSWETVPRGEGGSEGVLRVLEAIGSNLELRQVLYRLVDSGIELTGAQRALIFLREGDGFVPAAIATRRPTVEHFQRFQKMDPIAINENPERRESFNSGQLFVVGDSSDSPIVPQAWAEAFGPRSLALVPLKGEDELFGLLVIDHPVPYDYPPDELRVVRTIAETARIAIGNATLHERLARRADMQRELAMSLARIGSEVELRDVLLSIAESASRLFGGRACSITFGDDSVESAAQGMSGDRTSIPLQTGPTLHGYVTLSGGPPLDTVELEAFGAFAQQAAIAIDRARLAAEVRERDWRSEATARLADVLVGPADLGRVLDRLNATVCRESGFECVSVGFRRRRLAELLGASALTSDEIGLVARLATAAEAGVQQVDPDGLHAAPVSVSGRLAGVLFVRPIGGRVPLTDTQRALVGALASRIGEVAQQARLQSALREAESRLTLAAAHRRITERIDATLVRTIEAQWRELSAATAKHRDSPNVLHDLSRIRSLCARALMEVHAAAESAAVLGVHRDGLYRALGMLLRSFEAVSGTSATLRRSGHPEELPEELEERLYGIAFDALWAIERSARATTVVLTLSYDDGVRLTLRDDGLGLAQRGIDEAGPGVHFGFQSIRDRVNEVGGRLTFEAASPRGVHLEVYLPQDAIPGPQARPATQRTPARLQQLRERVSPPIAGP